MKKIMNLLLAASLVAFAACSDDSTTTPAEEGETPVFPSKISGAISMNDEGVSFDVTPNMAGTISIPQQEEMIRYFNVVINNERLTGYSRNVAAGTRYDITVTGKEEDFEASHTLVITLTMGDSSQEIAEVELMRAGSTIEVYAAELNDTGTNFKYEMDGDKRVYTYSSTPLADGAEIGLYEDYSNHLKVTANRNWRVTGPEWLNLSQTGGNSGVATAIDLASSDDIRPFEDAVGVLTFAVDEQTRLAEFPVSIDGCANDFESSIVSATNVVLKASAGTTAGSVKAAYGSQVFFACPDGREWIRLESGKGFTDNAWSEEEKRAGLHSKEFSAVYDANESYEDSRTAYLFCLPLGEKNLRPENALNADGSVAEGYAEYQIAQYTQQYTIAPRPEGTLNVQSMVGQGDSTPGEPLFAMVQEYAEGNYPEGWWGDALNDMPALFKLTLADMKYCEPAVMDVQNADEFEIVYHPDDVNNEWIREFGMDENGDLYRFIFKYEEIKDANGNTIDIQWTVPHVPQAYVICKQNGAVTGALIVEVDAESFDIPLQNASTDKRDIGFTLLTAGNFGYSDKYGDVPQYKVNGYNAASDMPDAQGRYSAGALMLTFNPGYGLDFDSFDYEPVENGLMTAQIGWPGWKGGDDADVKYIFVVEPMHFGSAPQITYLFAGDGPDQFRIVCRNKSGNIVCTVYVYYYNDYDWDE